MLRQLPSARWSGTGRGVEVAGMAFAVGDIVMLHPADGESTVEDTAAAGGSLGLLQALWQTSSGA